MNSNKIYTFMIQIIYVESVKNNSFELSYIEKYEDADRVISKT